MSRLELSHLSTSLIHNSSIISDPRQKFCPNHTEIKTKYPENPFNCFYCCSRYKVTWGFGLGLCFIGMCKRTLLRAERTCCLSAISHLLFHHCQLVHFLEMLHRRREAQSLGPSLCNWKSTFLRPLNGWNLSFEDIKRSILATGACDATKRSMVTQG